MPKGITPFQGGLMTSLRIFYPSGTEGIPSLEKKNTEKFKYLRNKNFLQLSEAHDILEVFCQFCKVFLCFVPYRSFKLSRKLLRALPSYPIYLS